MANTSRTMASRKRPPPTNNAAAANAVTTTAPAAGAIVMGGVDVLLAKYARHLPPGGTVTVQLIKGPSSQSVDPIAARKAAAKTAKENEKSSKTTNGGLAAGMSSGNDSDNGAAGAGGGAKAKGITAPLSFPRIAKFSETVNAPDFIKGSLRDGRMYEEEVPKCKDESDEEESTAYNPSNVDANGGEGADPAAAANPKKKKRRWRRNDPRPRRWVLQEKAEFFERIRKRRQVSSGKGGEEVEEQGISNQYNGVLESNASKYVMLSVDPTAVISQQQQQSSSQVASERISVQTVHGFHTFAQPHKTASLTMEEAENAIEQQRNVVTRYMMHGKMSVASQTGGAEAKAALAGGVATRGRGRSMGPAPKAMSRARLLGKLAGGGGRGGGGGDDDDGDDVMGDVKFSTSKGSSRARRELLTSMGDNVTADDDGVLGGANDTEFGGRRRFASVATEKNDGDDKKGGKGDSKSTSTGFEAGAMEEGFYQRDVAAEYEALDYDANEQFDDDDVNVGEGEMMDDGGGYGGAFRESDDDAGMDDSDDDDGMSDDDGLTGMASRRGLKDMMRRDRGESPPNPDVNNAPMPPGPDGTKDAKPEGLAPGKTIDKKVPSTTAPAPTDDGKGPSPGPAGPGADPVAKGIEKDKDGKRLITLESVRREIWLNSGAITSKRLMKKFEVSKKQPERQELFKQIVMELCNVKKDADGTKLVLKQHYSKI